MATVADVLAETGSSPIARHHALERLAAFVRRECAAPSPVVGVGGTVSDVSRSVIAVRGMSQTAMLGDGVLMRCGDGFYRGEVIRVAESHVLIKPFDDRAVPALGAPVFPDGTLRIAPSPGWKGRVVDALGMPLDGKGPLMPGCESMPADRPPPAAMRRARVDKGLRTGVNVIDIFVPMCFGQRLGIFAGSGVGKSTLLAMMTKATDFDTVVLALAGERGREVRDMLEDTMAGKLEKTVTVVATGDESPMMRRLAPNTATAIAEYFRDRGENVLLIVDSITRFAHAAREVAIAAEEPPVSRGYPPSVFSQLPRLLERAGPGLEGGGTITGIYSVLVDGDDHNDPVSDAIRGTLDGHIVLDRGIAAQGRFPAVDIPGSVSRLAQHGWTPEQKKLVTQLRGLIARFEETRDLRAIGAYQAGNDSFLDQAVTLVPKIYEVMQQTPDMPVSTDPYNDLAAALRKENT
ncbi:flagellar protein export ATPase FliI [Phyllobacterium phragmitis]|uniref:Flagellum-specific ATP synthase n=1 Tax=Phyllobacterium phragmitis TaxID=2670329 RepID=A0A2S9IQ74_9HYPH|nr:flagellar protein export ATPase FliI [Phyllobacterium phragmitis]PRD42678.1 flagellar protein export ATPase FliI [Phyllobacterium phragmitis]